MSVGHALARLHAPNKPFDLHVLHVSFAVCYRQRAQAFYKKEKMAVIAERKAYYHSPVEDAIIMKREIDEG